jgi:ParB/RepB/Spo0J family partition protein
MPVADIHEWEHNPRRQLRDIISLQKMVMAAGEILEPLHVWFHNGQYLVLQGHRRLAVARTLQFTEVPVIVEDLPDEASAMARLMQLQCGANAFDAMEESEGLRSMVDFGLTAGEVASVMGRSAPWVQLRLDLQDLPDTGKAALCKGQLEMSTAELILKLDKHADREAAVQSVLSPEFEEEPLSGVSARRMVESFLAIQESRKMWKGLVPQLAKKYKRRDGYSLIEAFEDGGTYCFETGHPVAPHGFADELVDARMLAEGKSGLTWGELAQKHGAAIFVAPAPLHKDGHVLLVNRQAIADAEDAARANGLEFFLRTEKVNIRKSGGGTPKDEAEPHDASDLDGGTAPTGENPWTIEIEACGKTRMDAIRHVCRVCDMMTSGNGWDVTTSDETGNAAVKWHQWEGDES